MSCSCEAQMNKKTFHIERRIYSPDSSKLILSYNFDIGAPGYTRTHTAIVNVADTVKKLSQFDIPYDYVPVNWIDNNTVKVRVNVLPYIRKNKKFVQKFNEIDNIKMKVFEDDYTGDGKIIVERRDTSPNKEYEIIAFRYIYHPELMNVLHISIVKVGEPMTKYGNFFIGGNRTPFDFLDNIKWTPDNTLLLYVPIYLDSGFEDHLVRNRPDIKYKKIITYDDENAYAWKYRYKETQ